MASKLLCSLTLLAFFLGFSYASPQQFHPSLQKRALVTPNNLPTNWTYQGCYNDSANARSIIGDYYSDGSKMTDESCIAYCSSKKYGLAGVEYSSECYCGNGLSSYAATTPAGDCNMGCSGNSSEACGGPNRLTVFKNPSLIPVHDPGPNGWTWIGCYTDQGTRTLATGYGTPGGQGSMTVALCVAVCGQNNQKYAGMEYANECYCANSITGGGGPAPDGVSGCNMVCSGNSSEFCGGPYRLDMYQAPGTGAVPVSISSSKSSSSTVVPSSTKIAASVTPSPTIKSTSTTPGTTAQVSSTPVIDGMPTTKPVSATPTTSNSAPATSALAANGLPTGWAYKGCYIDNANGRDLPTQLPDNSSLTVESCVLNCYQQGFSVAAMEYSTQCFCGNAIYAGGTLASSDTDCNMPCGGNAKEICGAGNRLSTYSNGTIKTYAPAVAQTSDLPGSWTYDGCYSDGFTKVLPYQILAPDNNSAKNCLSLCSAYGYPVGGMEYGRECYCGDPTDLTNGGSKKQASDAACNMACPGDPTYLCGAGNLLSLYRWTGTPLYTWHTPSGTGAGAYQLLIGGVVVPLITSQTITGKVTFLEKHGTSLAANSTGAYELDVSKVNNFASAWRTMNGLKTDVFCSAGLTLPDKAGRQITVGGWSLTSTFGVRLYWPGGPTNDWQENVNELTLQNGRWYPSAMIMANGKILVVGGESGSNAGPVPTLEILPTPAGGNSVVYLDFLKRTDPYNLYPFLAVLPSGGIFIAYYNEARILDENSFATTKQLPNIPGAVNNFLGGRTYPLEGTAVLMPQFAPYSDPLTILICGGSTPYAGDALDNCVSTQPEAAAPKWTLERMPSKRVMPCIATLPDGTYLILNGAHQGAAGFGLATSPNLNALLYDPSQPVGQRISIMANTIVARLYHSEAILLQDGRVMVSGSDPQDNVNPEEYRVEVFVPPYLLAGNAQPAYTITNTDWSYGSSVPITITSGSTANVRVSLLGAEASTHGNSMGQRILFPAVSCAGTTCTITAPPNAHVCPPGWFQVFVLDGPTPSKSTYVRIGGDPAGLGNWPGFADFDKPGV